MMDQTATPKGLPVTDRLNLVDIAATAHAATPDADALPLTPAEMFAAYEQAGEALTEAFCVRAGGDVIRTIHRRQNALSGRLHDLLLHYPGGIATPLGVYRAEHHGRVARYDLPTPLGRVAWPGVGGAEGGGA